MKQLNSYILSINSQIQQISRIRKKVENSLTARQNIVGGCIAIYSLTDEIDIIYREDFTMLDKQNAWIVYDEQGNEQIILYGTILCLRYYENDYSSLCTKDYDTINTLVVPITIFNSDVQKNGKHIIYRNH